MLASSAGPDAGHEVGDKTEAGVRGCAAAAAIFIAALVWGPWLLEGHHVRDSELAPSAGIIITGFGFRTMLVAIAIAIAGLGLYYTYRNHKHAEMLYAHSQEQFAHARSTDREQADLAREGQVTGRYIEASKLLASEKPTERLCGIYAFERIMRDRAKTRPPEWPEQFFQPEQYLAHRQNHQASRDRICMPMEPEATGHL